MEPPKSAPFAAGPSPGTAASTPANQAPSPAQYVNGAGAGPQPSSFMDPSGGLVDMDLMREEHMYGMTSEMMALFQDGGVDGMFPPDFMQQHLGPGQQVQQQQHHQSDRPGNSNGAPPGANFPSPGMFKMNGLATSP